MNFPAVSKVQTAVKTTPFSPYFTLKPACFSEHISNSAKK